MSVFIFDWIRKEGNNAMRELVKSRYIGYHITYDVCGLRMLKDVEPFMLLVSVAHAMLFLSMPVIEVIHTF